MGIVVTAIAMSMVFFALLMLVIIFSNTGNILKRFQIMVLQRRRKHLKSALAQQQVAVVEKSIRAEGSGEEYAAIAAAIYFYNNELHDEENTILTIAKTARPWTPWSEKYYSMNNYFTRRNR
jgi:Na+-transporting methylmalonyl-CoA/oxaloacetate decarboxylase gamma subunit